MRPSWSAATQCSRDKALFRCNHGENFRAEAVPNILGKDLTGTIYDDIGCFIAKRIMFHQIKVLTAIRNNAGGTDPVILDSLLSAAFHQFPYETFFLVLIDRVERKTGVWNLSAPRSLRDQTPLDKSAG